MKLNLSLMRKKSSGSIPVITGWFTELSDLWVDELSNTWEPN